VRRGICPRREETGIVTKITWKVVPAVPQLALVGYRDNEVVATIELDGILRYRLVSATGDVIGRYPTISEATAALHTREIEREWAS
jgi:hypothetical protein